MRLSVPANRFAHWAVEQFTAEGEREPFKMSCDLSQIIAENGHKGGKIVGKRRIDTMIPIQRHEMARSDERDRWKKPKKEGSG